MPQGQSERLNDNSLVSCHSIHNRKHSGLGDWVIVMTSTSSLSNFFSSFVQALCFLNPLIGSNYLINIFAELEEAKEQVSIWIDHSKDPLLNPLDKEKILRGLQKFERLSSLWTTIFQYLIAALLFYLCLYLFIERVSVEFVLWSLNNPSFLGKRNHQKEAQKIQKWFSEIWNRVRQLSSCDGSWRKVTQRQYQLSIIQRRLFWRKNFQSNLDPLDYSFSFHIENNKNQRTKESLWSPYSSR